MRGDEKFQQNALASWKSLIEHKAWWML